MGINLNHKANDFNYYLGLSSHVDPSTDFALLKVDFAANANKVHLQDRTGFPYIEVSSRELAEGEPVYSFGYPLSESGLLVNTPGVVVGHAAHSPRVTSAIVASTMESTRLVTTTADTKVYVLDKALNYGNSGGPIVATDTGKVHALCSRFQPVRGPRSWDRPLYTLITAVLGERPQGNLFKINILIFFDILSYTLISH